MTPPYRDSFPSDHDHLLLRYSSPDRLFFSTTTPQTSSSSSSLFFSGLDHSNGHDPRLLELKHEDGAGQIIMACNKDQAQVETGLRFTIWKQIEKSDQNSSCCENNLINNDLVRSSSSSSKIRLVINSNQTNNDSPGFQDLNRMSSLPDQSNKRSALNDSGGAIIRTCSDCNTTKTPLWRSGPRGPKSLCNACGIRQRKARRAMAAAAAAANGAIPTAVVLKTNKAAVQQRKIMKPKMKKKCKAVVSGGDGGGGRKKLSFEEMKMVRRLSEISSAYQRVFPQDEREAAILLMTLSYGLISG